MFRRTPNDSIVFLMDEPLAADTFEYTPPRFRGRQYLWLLFWAFFAILGYLPFEFWVKGRWEVVPALLAGLIGVSGFLAVISLGSVATQAGNRYIRVLDSVAAFMGANEGLRNNIFDLDEGKLVEDKEELIQKCMRTWTRFLRVLCCKLRRESFTVIIDGKAHKDSVAAVIECLRADLKAAGISGIAIGSNGRMHVVAGCRFMLQLIMEFPLPFSMYVSTAVLFLNVFLALGTFIALIGGPASKIIGPVFCGLFGGGAALVVIVARNRATPFSKYRSDFGPNRLFKSVEKENEEAETVRQKRRSRLLNPKKS